jgi:uncharacterized protein YecA (UPF0149 family)
MSHINLINIKGDDIGIMARSEDTYEYDLAYKKHDQFFQNLNHQLQTIAGIAAECLTDILNLNRYYSWLSLMLNMYYVYIIDDNELETLERELQTVRETLYSERYVSMLRRYNHLSPKERTEMSNMQTQSLEKMNKVLRFLMENLKRNQLIPNPVKEKQNQIAVERAFG